MPSVADTQLTEIFGRNRLINDLLLSGVEVATPVRDRGVDLIAYVDLYEQIGRFAAVPIQIKAATQRSFTIDRKYERFGPSVCVRLGSREAGNGDDLLVNVP